VLFVTNHAPPYRVGAFAELHRREDVVFALVGGAVRHGGGGTREEALPFPALRIGEREVLRLAASGAYRTVIAGLSGRVALPSAWLGARRARVPFVLWATVWRHPRTPAHALSYLPLRHIYRDADAIATYGPHVSAYVRARGARNPVFEAPQAVDGAFWGAPASEPRRQSAYQAAFVGRISGEKGVAVLIRAWRASGLRAPAAALVLVGEGRFRAPPLATGAVDSYRDLTVADRAGGAATGAVAAPPGSASAAPVPPGPVSAPSAEQDPAAPHSVGRQPPTEVRNFYAGSDVVVLPSIPTRDFLEPWGLVVNEAFHQGRPVIATNAVGAVAGGLVRHERNGLVVPAGDEAALAGALRRLHDDPALRERLGAQARRDVAPYTFDAWADGFVRALAAVGAARSPIPPLPEEAPIP
jgi:glycosyltransferase involved in cell wall biosynthesis